MRPLGRDGAEQRKVKRSHQVEERTGTETGRSALLSGISGFREKNESQEYGISGRREKKDAKMGWAGIQRSLVLTLRFLLDTSQRAPWTICIRYREFVNSGFLGPNSDPLNQISGGETQESAFK